MAGTQPFLRDPQATPRSSAPPHSAFAGSSAAGHGLPACTNSAHPGRPAMALQISPKLRASLPILEEQQLPARLEHFALPSVASLPPERHLQPSAAAQSLPLAPRTFAPRRELRQPQLEQTYPGLAPLAPFRATQQPHPHSISSSAMSQPQQPQQQQQQVSAPGVGLMSEAGNTGGLPDVMARHERSSSGQEQGLAMAEQVINAYKLGLKASEAPDKNTTIPGTCILRLRHFKLHSAICDALSPVRCPWQEACAYPCPCACTVHRAYWRVISSAEVCSVLQGLVRRVHPKV